MTEADPAPAYQRAKAPPDFARPLEDESQLPIEGRAPAGERSGPRGSVWEEREREHRQVLAELEAIHRLLGVPWDSGVGAPPVAPPISDASPDPSSRGAASPYLDDRLAAAAEAAAALATEFAAMQQRTQRLGASVATLREELGRATEELAFLRSGSGVVPAPPATDAARPSPRTARPANPAESPAPPALGPGVASPAYGSFTVSRYNATVREVRRRRPTLFVTTLALAAAISAALVTIAYLAREPMPPWWLAVLPLVWMIPVPFFLAAFVGTHRILASQSLELPEAA